MTAETAPATRERRFKKLFLGAEGQHLDADEIGDVHALGIEIDGRVTSVQLKEFGENALKRLVLEGLYGMLTRAVHAAKPAAETPEEALEIILAAQEKIKAGNFKRDRKSGISSPRAFDPTRFKTAVYAAAKSLNQVISEEKFERLLGQLSAMSGQDRQRFISKNFMRDPHFKTVWDKPILEKRKALIKKGELESSLADLTA